MEPFAQIRIGLAQHTGAGVRLHALDRGFRGETGGDRLLELVHPAAVMGEHAVGVEHLAVLAAVGDVAALQQGVEIGTQRFQRGHQPRTLLLRIVGNHVGDDDARLVQHDMAERDAVVERGAGKVQRPAHGWFRAGLGDGGELARGDHFRQHHGGGLQRLDFLFRIGAARAVLHHQNAEHVAGAQDRHAEERVVDFFAGFRTVGVGRVGLSFDRLMAFASLATRPTRPSSVRSTVW